MHPWVSDGAQRIRFGISAVAQSWPEMHDLAQMAEGLGFDYVKHGRSELGRGAYTPADAGHKFQVLQRRCEEAGRPYGSILRATQFSPLILAETEAGVQAKLDRFPKELLAFLEQTVLATTSGDAIERMQALVDVGFQYFLCSIAVNDVETLNLLAQQVIPAMVA